MTPLDWAGIIVPIITLAGVIYGAGKISATVNSIDRRLSRIEQWIDSGAWRPSRRRSDHGYSD